MQKILVALIDVLGTSSSTLVNRIDDNIQNRPVQ